MNNEGKRSAPTIAQRQPKNGCGLIRNRIQELRLVMASELIPNPKNWRQHSQLQQNVLRGLFAVHLDFGHLGVVLKCAGLAHPIEVIHFALQERLGDVVDLFRLLKGALQHANAMPANKAHD